MKVRTLSVFLFVVCVLHCTAGKHFVMALEEEEFDSYIKKKDIVIVDVYSPTCPHCKKLAPEFLKAAKKADADKKPYNFVKIDAARNPNIGKVVPISGFPTVKLFYKGTPIDYEGNRTATEILEFIDKKVGSQSTLLSNAAAIREILGGKGYRCFLATDDKKYIEEYENMVRDENVIVFYHSSFKDAKEVFPQITVNPSIILATEEGETLVYDKAGLPKKYFKEFLRYHEYPVVAPCTEKLLEGLEKSKRTAIFLFRDSTEANSPLLDAEYKELATKWRSKEYVFVLSEIKEGSCKKVAENFGIEAKHLPTMQIIASAGGDKARYAKTAPLTGNDMKKLMQDWKDGKAERAYKSEEIPTNEEGTVIKLVGKNWEKEVIQSDADVLVKFYAPWCGHCQKLAPIYKELAEKLKTNKKIKIAEIDSTKNEIPGVSIQGYPTLKLYQAKNKKNPINYEGERSLADLKKFLEAQTSFPSDFKKDL